MKLSSPAVYPITAAFEKFLIEKGIVQEVPEDEDGPAEMVIADRGVVGNTAKTMLETLGEYEHGLGSELVNLYELVSPEEWMHREDDEWKKGLISKALNILSKTYEDLLLTMMSL